MDLHLETRRQCALLSVFELNTNVQWPIMDFERSATLVTAVDSTSIIYIGIDRPKSQRLLYNTVNRP